MPISTQKTVFLPSATRISGPRLPPWPRYRAPAVYVLSLRNPIEVANALGNLAQLSNNRVILGAGAGWMKEEFEVYGVGFKVLPYFRSTETNKNGANDQRGGEGELHVMSRDQDLSSSKLVNLFQEAAVECGVPQRADFCDGVAEGVGWTQACIDFIELETKMLHHTMGRADAVEGGMAFFERRDPKWTSSVSEEWPEELL